MSFYAMHAAIPAPVHWCVIGGLPIVAWLEVVNPIMQFTAFAVAIAWGLFQIFIAYRRKAWRS